MFAIFEKLVQHEIDFCLQHKASNDFYNLAVVDPKGKSHYFHGSLQDIEESLKIMWGHLLESPPISKPVGMPLPPSGGMPTPW